MSVPSLNPHFNSKRSDITILFGFIFCFCFFNSAFNSQFSLCTFNFNSNLTLHDVSGQDGQGSYSMVTDGAPLGNQLRPIFVAKRIFDSNPHSNFNPTWSSTVTSTSTPVSTSTSNPTSPER